MNWKTQTQRSEHFTSIITDGVFPTTFLFFSIILHFGDLDTDRVSFGDISTTDNDKNSRTNHGPGIVKKTSYLGYRGEPSVVLTQWKVHLS